VNVFSTYGSDLVDTANFVYENIGLLKKGRYRLVF